MFVSTNVDPDYYQQIISNYNFTVSESSYNARVHFANSIISTLVNFHINNNWLTGMGLIKFRAIFF